MPRPITFFLVVLASLVLVACGGDDYDEGAAASAESTVPFELELADGQWLVREPVPTIY